MKMNYFLISILVFIGISAETVNKKSNQNKPTEKKEALHSKDFLISFEKFKNLKPRQQATYLKEIQKIFSDLSGKNNSLVDLIQNNYPNLMELIIGEEALAETPSITKTQTESSNDEDDKTPPELKKYLNKLKKYNSELEKLIQSPPSNDATRLYNNIRSRSFFPEENEELKVLTLDSSPSDFAAISAELFLIQNNFDILYPENKNKYENGNREKIKNLQVQFKNRENQLREKYKNTNKQNQNISNITNDPNLLTLTKLPVDQSNSPEVDGVSYDRNVRKEVEEDKSIKLNKPNPQSDKEIDKILTQTIPSSLDGPRCIYGGFLIPSTSKKCSPQSRALIFETKTIKCSKKGDILCNPLIYGYQHREATSKSNTWDTCNEETELKNTDRVSGICVPPGNHRVSARCSEASGTDGLCTARHYILKNQKEWEQYNIDLKSLCGKSSKNLDLNSTCGVIAIRLEELNSKIDNPFTKADVPEFDSLPKTTIQEDQNK